MRSQGILIVLCGALLPGLLLAQGGDADLRRRLEALEVQNRAISERLQAAEASNAELRGEVSTLKVEASEFREIAEDGLLEEQVNAALGRLRQESNWISATKSGLPLRFYGFFRFDYYFNSARSNNVLITAFARPEGKGHIGHNDSETSFDVRMTRFGVDLDAGTLGSADVTAKLETDFQNFPSGTTESRQTPRIRLAYMDFDWGDFSIRLGQDWDVISPLYPSVHTEFVLWLAGNTGDRRPMVQLRYETGDPQGTVFTAILAAGETGAVDGLDLDRGLVSPTILDGFDSAVPHGQARVGVSFPGWVSGTRIRLDIWGYVASLETELEYNGNDSFTPWTVGASWHVPLIDTLALRGEVWYGQALSDIRGTIGQSVNPLQGDEIQGWGGWMELTWQICPELKLVLGGSVDNPESDDLAPGGRDLNWVAYAGAVYDFGGGLKSGLDVMYWETQYEDDSLGNLVHINFFTMLSF